MQLKRIFVFTLFPSIYFTLNAALGHEVDGSTPGLLRSNRELNDAKRPIMYTFVYMGRSNASLNELSLAIWADAWYDMGFEPIILTGVDASRHPDYDNYMKKLESSDLAHAQWGSLLRYLAMTSQPGNGGWYSDKSVLPVRDAIYFEGKGIDLPNNGMFTMHDPHLPLLLSANYQNWNFITSLIINAKATNDALILHTLMRENKNRIVSEDALIHVKDVMKLNDCADLNNKLATKVTSGIASLGFKSYDDYQETVNSSLENCVEVTKISVQKCKPTIYTFFVLDDNLPIKKIWPQLDQWTLAWREAGWNAIVLTLDNAKLHPLFEIFSKAFEKAPYQMPKKDIMCYYRWLAMATLPKGGWMSEYDNIPLHLHGYKNCNIPNDGRLTIYEKNIPSLASGSKSEWNRMVQLLLSSYELNHNIFWNDISALEDIYRNQNSAYIQKSDSISIYNVYSNPPSYMRTSFSYSHALFIDTGAIHNNPFDLKKFCYGTSSKLSVHFSHKSCFLAKFCMKDREAIISKWLASWKKSCLHERK